MPEKEEIEKNIFTIWKISILANKCLKYSQYLHKPETDDELDFLNHSREFHFIRHVLWRNTVIELSKLFSFSPKRDKYNIYHFINKFKKDQCFGGFKIEESKIQNWESRLEENKKIISAVLLLRDKVYGHTDNENSRKDLDTPTFEETLKLIEIVETIVQEIYSIVLDSDAIIRNPIVDENPSRIIKILAANRKDRINALQNFRNSK